MCVHCSCFTRALCTFDENENDMKWLKFVCKVGLYYLCLNLCAFYLIQLELKYIHQRPYITRTGKSRTPNETKQIFVRSSNLQTLFIVFSLPSFLNIVNEPACKIIRMYSFRCNPCEVCVTLRKLGNDLLLGIVWPGEQ